MSESVNEILKDSWLGKELFLLESIDIPKGKCSNNVILASLKGPVMDFINDTRNDRLYEESLCDSIAESSYVKELQETNNFLGEPDHPMAWEERTDIHYPNVSHAIRNLVKVEEEGCYKATVDILDTPNGRILKTLLDYGTKLGLSSRGAGRVIKRSDGRSIVDPSTYKFFTFDIVAMPGNKGARLDNSDSINESLIRALTEQVNTLVSSRDISSLESTKNVLSNLNIEGCSFLLEKVDNMLDKEKNKEILLSGNKEKDKKEIDGSTIKGVDDEKKSSSIEKGEILKASILNVMIMKKELNQLKDVLISLIDKVDLLCKENDNLNTQVTSLRNLSHDTEEELDLKKEPKNESYNNNFINEYFYYRCKQLGLNESIIFNRLGYSILNCTRDEIDEKLLECVRTIKYEEKSMNMLPNNKIRANYINSNMRSDENNKSDYLCNISDIVSAVKDM